MLQVSHMYNKLLGFKIELVLVILNLNSIGFYPFKDKITILRILIKIFIKKLLKQGYVRI